MNTMTHEAQATAVFFVAPYQTEIRNFRIAPGKGEALVTSTIMGISHGTELLFYRGEIEEGTPLDETIDSLQEGFHYPVKYGYINVGRTAGGDTGKGRRVFCFYPHQDSFFYHPGQWIEIPDDVSDRNAVFLASMETAVSIVQDCAPLLGERVCVIGQGVIGLLVTALLTRFHYGMVIAVERYHRRRNAARELGAVVVDPDTSEAESEIRRLSNGGGVDRVIHTSGSSEGLQLAVDILAREGTLIEASWYGTNPVDVRLGGRFHRNRVQVKSSQVSTIGGSLLPRWDKERRMNLAFDLLRSIDPSRYITHTFPLHKAGEAFELIDRRPEETIQVVLTL
jgi:threonine dehydrogenase-like Zn-dependent dehydrogenase